MNKLYLYGGIAAAIGLILLTIQVMSWRTDAHKLAAEIAQHNADNLQCTKDKALTKEINDELQNDRDRIADKLAAAKRMPATCITIESQQANAVKAGAEHAGRNGIGLNTDWLLGFAAQCETYRSERIALEKFIDQQSAD